MRFKTFPVFFLIAFAFYMMAGAAYADDDGHHAKFRRCFCLQPFEPGVEGGVEDGGFPFLKLCLSKRAGVKLVTGEFFPDPSEGDLYPNLIFGTWKIKNGDKYISFTFNRTFESLSGGLNVVVNTGTIILSPRGFDGDVAGEFYILSTFGSGSEALTADVRRIPCPK